MAAEASTHGSYRTGWPYVLRLASVEVARFEPDIGTPVTLVDGAELRALVRFGRRFFVLDHRSRPDLPARVEFWECLVGGETHVCGLFALCDAADPRGRTPTVGRELIAS